MTYLFQTQLPRTGLSFPAFSVLGALALGMGGLGCSSEGNANRNAEQSSLLGTGGGVMPSDVEMDTATVDSNGELLLDTLEDGNDRFLAAGISGEWFSYSDGTSTIEPADHSGIGDTPGEVHVLGEGFSDWGAGLSAYFSSVDLAGYTGFKVRIKGTGTVRVEVATPETSPAGEGGTCEGDGCFGHYNANLELSEQYEDVTISFDSLTQPGWAQQVDLSLSGVISINFLAPANGAMADLDLWVDQLSLVGGTPN